MAFAPGGYYEFEPSEFTDCSVPIQKGHTLSIILNREQVLALIVSITKQLEINDECVIIDYKGEMKFDPPEVIEIEGESHFIA